MFFINDWNAGDDLRKLKIYDRAGTQSHIKLRGDFLEGALFDAYTTSGAYVRIDVARFAAYLNVKIANITFYINDFTVVQQFNIGMSTDIHHFWAENSYATVESREGFVQLGHLPPNGWLFFNKINLVA